MRNVSLILLTLILFAAQSQACDSCSKGRQHFRATEAVLVEGMGRHHHPVTTSNEEAQCFFDQGLTYCIAFNHDEGVRSFRKAAELDSTLAMAYWGMAHALGSNYNIPIDSAREIEAYQYIQKALALAHHASPAEQDYIKAMAVRYTNDPRPNYAALDSAYKNAMGELHKKYPDDQDVAVLYAEAAMNLRPWMLWSVDGKPAPGTLEIVEILESVLERNPEHSGALHFYIHAMEASPNPERTLTAAYELADVVPAAGHLVHMPGHAFIRNGYYEESIKANHAAVTLDSTYVAAGGGSGFYSIVYYPHNIHFLSVSYALDGQYKNAVHYADMLNEVAGSTYSLDPHFEGIGPTKFYILTKFGKWAEILAEPKPDTNLKVMTAVWHFARGMAFAGTGDVKKAKKELAAFDKIKFSSAALFGVINSATAVAPIPRLLLEAKIAVAENRTEDAITALYKAADIQDSLAYDEPEAWYIASRETLGSLLVKTGRLDEAEKVFRQDLVHYPRNGRSLFGLKTVLQQLGKKHEAAMIEQDFKRSWARSDTPLSMDAL